MLVLTRKCQEKIQIGENITITIVRVKGQSVRVGIDAPRDMKVMRTELPPESPTDEADQVTNSLTENTAPDRRRTAASDATSAARQNDNDCKASYRGTPQPLSQYIPGTRMLTVTCAG